MQSDETTRDSSRDDSKRTDTVLVSLRASGAAEKIYHTDPEDCPAVGDMMTPAEKPRDVLGDDWRECRYCSGDFETGGVPEGVDPGATREALLEDVDPDDLRADGGEVDNDSVYKAAETRIPVSRATLREARRKKEDAGFPNYDEFISALVDDFDPEGDDGA